MSKMGEVYKMKCGEFPSISQLKACSKQQNSSFVTTFADQ
jgi:hypothetical protein